VIDIRANISSTKAHNFFLIRPKTDYAFNLAVIHALLNQDLYDRAFADLWISDLKALQQFVKPYTPEWAEKETGIEKERLLAFVRELAEAKPAVVWHPGWMTADTWIPSILSVPSTSSMPCSLRGLQGRDAPDQHPSDVGRKGLKKFVDLYPKPQEKRADGVGWRYPHFDSGPGSSTSDSKRSTLKTPILSRPTSPTGTTLSWAFRILSLSRRSFRSWICWFSVTFSWSDTAWLSDVVLPLSPYLERESILASKNGLKPYFFVRHRAAEPRFDTRSDWEIISGLSKRLGLDALAFNSAEEVWSFQLEGTG